MLRLILSTKSIRLFDTLLIPEIQYGTFQRETDNHTPPLHMAVFAYAVMRYVWNNTNSSPGCNIQTVPLQPFKHREATVFVPPACLRP
jgi:hypothetical protein